MVKQHIAILSHLATVVAGAILQYIRLLDSCNGLTAV